MPLACIGAGNWGTVSCEKLGSVSAQQCPSKVSHLSISMRLGIPTQAVDFVVFNETIDTPTCPGRMMHVPIVCFVLGFSGAIIPLRP